MKLTIRKTPVPENAAPPPVETESIDKLLKRSDALLGQNRFEDAVALLGQALDLDNRNPRALRNLAVALFALKQFSKAHQAFQLLVQVEPQNPMHYFEMGRLLERWGKVDAAVGAYLQAIQLNPKFAEAYNNLGNQLVVSGHLSNADAAFQQAVNLKPELHAAQSNRLANLNYRADLTAKAIAEAHFQWGNYAEESAFRPSRYPNKPDKSRKLRIGFVSPDLYRHSVGYFLLPLLKAIDSNAFEIYAYDTGPIQDAFTEELHAHCNMWIGANRFSPAKLATTITRDAVDILIDLCGHFSLNSLQTFARKPAPVQLSWLGYPNTTGLKSVDYRITDSLVDPEGTDDLYTEQLIRFENGHHCYSLPPELPELTDTPSLENDFITFGSFNNNAKISPACAVLWSAVLDAVPGSRLLLKSKWFADEGVCSTYRQLFGDVGDNADRIEFLPWGDTSADGIAQYKRVDIALDTFPYNGTTTTCEAAAMGVPTLTLAGDRPVARVGASLLAHLGRPEWIATSPGQLIETAKALASDPIALNGIRRGLREELLASNLCNAHRLTSDFEAALRLIWGLWCDTATTSAPATKQPPKATDDSSTTHADSSFEKAIDSVEAPHVARKTKTGVLYVFWGEKAKSTLQRSSDSLKAVHPELPVEVVELPPDSCLPDKAKLFDLSPFEETIFLDTDTVVLQPLHFAVGKARKHGLACAICECPWAKRYGGLGGNLVEYNTGVLFFSREARPVFNRWKELAHEIDSSIRFYVGDQLRLMPNNDQAAFAKAVDEWESTPFVLPLNWNFRPIWHRSFFGPIHVWHDYSEPPASLKTWNASQTRPDSIIQFTEFNPASTTEPRTTVE